MYVYNNVEEGNDLSVVGNPPVIDNLLTSQREIRRRAEHCFRVETSLHIRADVM